jgi:hypothetical protein
MVLFVTLHPHRTDRRSDVSPKCHMHTAAEQQALPNESTPAISEQQQATSNHCVHNIYGRCVQPTTRDLGGKSAFTQMDREGRTLSLHRSPSHFCPRSLRPLCPPAAPPGSGSPLIDHRRASSACACTGAQTHVSGSGFGARICPLNNHRHHYSLHQHRHPHLPH